MPSLLHEMTTSAQAVMWERLVRFQLYLKRQVSRVKQNVEASSQVKFQPVAKLT